MNWPAIGIVVLATAAFAAWLLIPRRRQPLADSQRRALAAKVTAADGRQAPIGDLVQHPALTAYQRYRDGQAIDPDPGLGCKWCTDDDDFDVTRTPSWWGAPCTCATTCPHPDCPAPGAAA